ncbi:MAG: hypothetical protein PHG03_06045 [Bacilli bacterium]|nr:hypothetical protein [Bacilli bacterium]
MEWFFDGIGTEIISFILGGITGGITVGSIMYNKFVKVTKVVQKQNARDNAKQTQIGGKYDQH